MATVGKSGTKLPRDRTREEAKRASESERIWRTMPKGSASELRLRATRFGAAGRQVGRSPLIDARAKRSAHANGAAFGSPLERPNARVACKGSGDEVPGSRLERETGFEPATSTLARSHSTTELFPPCQTLSLHKRAEPDNSCVFAGPYRLT